MKETINGQALKKAGYKFMESSNHEFRLEVGTWRKRVTYKGSSFLLFFYQYANRTSVNQYDWEPSFLLETNCFDGSAKEVEINLVDWLKDNGRHSQITIREIELACISIAERLSKP